MIDVTITIAGLHDRTACDILEFLCKCFQSLGSKANNGLLGFDLSLIEWILFEEISVVVRVKELLLVSWIDFLIWFLTQ